MVYNIYFYDSEWDAVVVMDMDGKQLVIDCKKGILECGNGKKKGKCVKRYNKRFYVAVSNLCKGEFDNV